MGSSIISDISASGGEKPVLILDYGSQYTHLITRRIRQLSILTVCINGTSPLHAIASLNPSVIILSGGPNSVHAADAPSFPDGFLQYAEENGVPVLGICYGMQLIVQKLGGEVSIGEKHEYGKMEIAVTDEESGFFGPEAADGHQTVWMSHGDEALRLPEGFKVVARSLQGSVAAIENPSKMFYGLQYHPEVTHSPKGMESLRHFLIDVCGVPTEWNMEDVLEEQIISVKNMVGPDEHVICGLSGGVDSTVAAMLVHKAIGDRLHCLFVDNGLLRFKERERVMSSFQNELHLPVTCFDASEQFLCKLKGVKDPERKRKIIGEEFIRVFEAFAPKVEVEVGRRPSFLLQGTLYPDVIESCPPPGSGRTHSHTIKSHHNVGGLPEKMNLKLIEPLKLLFKDEVRKLGKILNVPESFLKRHPFPGPGLAVRVLGDVTEGNALNILREVDEIFIQSIKDAGLYDLIWQAFAVFLPVRSVGVQGDQRTHANVVALRAITSEDGMTADCALKLLSAVRATWMVTLQSDTSTSVPCGMGLHPLANFTKVKRPSCPLITAYKSKSCLQLKGRTIDSWNRGLKRERILCHSSLWFVLGHPSQLSIHCSSSQEDLRSGTTRFTLFHRTVQSSGSCRSPSPSLSSSPSLPV